MTSLERIVVDPLVLGSKPVIKGTHIAVEFIVDLLANGWSEADILHNYPGLTREDILACLTYASAVLQSEDAPRLPVAWEIRPALQRKRAEILKIAARHGGSNVRLIGAMARGEARADQDLDILISLGPERSSFALGAIKAELEALLGCRVWVVTENGLSHEQRESVLKEAVGL